LIKIVFVCGTLESGKDGVGDYTRRLAGELIRQGHEASIIAIHDRYATELLVGFQPDEQTAVPVLRIPPLFSSKSKLPTIFSFINRANPDWVSLQYVPFSFHPKGLHLNNRAQTCRTKKYAWSSVRVMQLEALLPSDLQGKVTLHV